MSILRLAFLDAFHLSIALHLQKLQELTPFLKIQMAILISEWLRRRLKILKLGAIMSLHLNVDWSKYLQGSF